MENQFVLKTVDQIMQENTAKKVSENSKEITLIFVGVLIAISLTAYAINRAIQNHENINKHKKS